MPLPIDALLRVQASPVPAQIVFGACGSMATAPMDCAASLSKMGLNVVPPFEDFHTPPLAVLFYGGERRHAPAHGGGADVSRAEARYSVGIEFRFLRRRGPGKNHR